MKLTVLVDNNTFIDMYYLGEPGVSYYIEDGDDHILFDTAYSDVFMSNAKKMGIDLSSVNKVVLSHGHNDHTGGLAYYIKNFNGFELISHPEVFGRRYHEGLDISSPLKEEDLKEKCVLELSREPVEISENIIYLGEIETVMDFEKRYALGNIIKAGKETPDYIYDDSAIVCKSDKGLFIITGCSHSGICNIIEYAKKVTGISKVYGVIGGFHLFDVNERLEKTIAYLQKEEIGLLYPCHCVSLKAKLEMGKYLQINETGVGLTLEF